MGKIPTFDIEQRYWDNGYDLVIGIDEVGRGAFAGPVVVGAVAFASNESSRLNESASARRDLPQQRWGVSDPSTTVGMTNCTIQTCGIDDSKRLTAKERELLEPLIKTHALCWSIGVVDVSIINRVGIGKATYMAMRKAVKQIANYQIANCELRSTNYGENSHPDRPCLPAGRSGGIFRPPVDSHGRFLDYARNDGKCFLLIDAFNIKHVPGVGIKNQLAIVKGDQQSISIAAASILAKVYRDKLMERLAHDYNQYGWNENKGYGTQRHRDSINAHGKCKHHRVQFVETWERNRK